jgi:hypothetical protein
MQGTAANDPELYSHFVRDRDLFNAVGRVALEATIADEALREILTCILGLNAMLIFEGQSSDWLIKMAQLAAHEFDPRHHYIEADRVKFDNYLQRIEELRQIRNVVVHGNWVASTVYVDDEVLPRPWGVIDGVTPYVCTLSRLRKWGNSRFFTVGDVEETANKLHNTTKLLIKSFIRMNDGNDVVRRGDFSRWKLDDIHHPEAAWQEPM